MLVINKNYDCKDDIKPAPKAEPVIEELPALSLVPVEQPLPEPEPVIIEPVAPPPRSPSPLEIRRPLPPPAKKTEEVIVIELKTPVLKTPAKIVPPHRSPEQVVNSIEKLMREREERNVRDNVNVLQKYSTDELVVPPISPLVMQAPPVNSPHIEPKPEPEPEPEILAAQAELPPKKPLKRNDFDATLNTAHRAQVRRQQKLAREEAEAIAQSSVPSKHRGTGSSSTANRGPSPPNSSRRDSEGAGSMASSASGPV